MTADDLFTDEQNAPPAEANPAIEPEPKIRTHLLEALDNLGVALGRKVEAPTLEELRAQPDATVVATSARVIDAVNLALQSSVRPTVPSLDVQIRNFEAWQSQRGVGYFTWPPAAMARLRAKLIELGEGVELQPCYAHSVGVRLQDGLVVFIDRAGNVRATAA
jgi:hypothetical protein